MDESELLRNADFLSIALEEMEHENYEVAEDFVEDVYNNILTEIDE